MQIRIVDFLGIKSPRFEMVYQLHRFGEDYEDNLRIRIKTTIPDDNSSIDSVTPVWRGADWLEREVFDMFPGKWKVTQIQKNYPAQAFWRSVIGNYTNGNFSESYDEKRKSIQEFDTSINQ